ncbi:Neurotrophin 1 like protein [Argiope bruennichi]|uniref:Neurotrophin 1 like protein n=1 Tax=Argiope bruennichi TaxID=94029 RepID=A0A8T0FDI2_ARGBR|nr:Neurotrophin 1 like protein [Argiope bruennichi]
MTASSEPSDFDDFFGPGAGFFSPPEEGAFGTFSGLSFYPKDSAALAGGFKTPFPLGVPLYTDGQATPPQVTLSKLEKEYKATLQKLASSQPPLLNKQHFHGSRHQERIPRLNLEPFSAASNIDERKQNAADKYRKNPDGSFSSGGLTSQPQIQTGFVPIVNGKRSQGPSPSSVIKDLPPPILTASSRPNTFKVSASVQSASFQNASSLRGDEGKSRQSGYSRNLRGGAGTTSSESVISRVVTKPAKVPKSQEKDLLRLAPMIQEDVKTAAKKTLDINCEGSRDLGWCELGSKYPRKYVNQVVAACQDSIQRMHVEVPHSFEKLSDISDFKAELSNSTQREAKERGSHDAWSWASYFHEGSLCDAETGFLRPETAKDSSGKWNIIVQTDAIRQRVPIEMCRKTNSSCKKMLNCGLKSQCLQKYNYHLLMSLNPSQKHDCPFMKLYRFPSACVCHVE